MGLGGLSPKSLLDSSRTCSIGRVGVKRERLSLDWLAKDVLREGRLRFLTKLNVRLNTPGDFGVLGLSFDSSLVSGSALVANGSMLRKSGFCFSRRPVPILLVRGGCRPDPEEVVQKDMRRSRTGSVTGRVDVLRRQLAGRDRVDILDEGREEASLMRLGDTDLRGRSITEGFPAYTTETILAVSSRLPRRSEARDSSLPESVSKSEKSSADEEASSSEERYTS